MIPPAFHYEWKSQLLLKNNVMYLAPVQNENDNGFFGSVSLFRFMPIYLILNYIFNDV